MWADFESIAARASPCAFAAAISAASDSSNAGRIPSSSETRCWYPSMRPRMSSSEPNVISRSAPFERRSFVVFARRSFAASTARTWRSSFVCVSLMRVRAPTNNLRWFSASASSACNSAVAASTSARVSSMTSIDPTSSAAPKRHPDGANLSPRRVTTIALEFASTMSIAPAMSFEHPTVDKRESRSEPS